MLQPLNLNPIQPQLAESSLGILDGAGPTSASANEFNPLFTRNRFSLQLNGVVAQQDSDLEPDRDHNTRSTDLVHSAVWGRYSYSLGTFHDYNEGIRPNHDQDREIDNAFFQAALDHKTSVQFEYRNTQTEQGDLPLRFDPALFSSNERTFIDNRILRFGMRHDIAPGNTLLFSALRKNYEKYNHDRGSVDFGAPFGTIHSSTEVDGTETAHTFEMQHQLNRPDYRLISGIGTNRSDLKVAIDVNYLPPFCPPLCPLLLEVDTDTRHHNGYLYAHLDQGTQLTWTLGISVDDLEIEFRDDTRFNPKLGLTWQVNNSTTLRAAAFRSQRHSITSNQTLEPTHIAGFNQFYDDINGTDSRRYGIAVEKREDTLTGGIELSKRNLEVPIGISAKRTGGIILPHWKEQLGRAYLYWTPLTWLASSAEYQHEAFQRPPENSADHRDTTIGTPDITTQKLPLSINLFLPNGLTTRLTATHLNQTGRFYHTATQLTSTSTERFWMTDASISYRLNRRMGRITLGAQNLLDKSFRYHNIDYATNRVIPERVIYTRLSVSL